MTYGREESFLGHVHRHPARLEYVHAADRDGRLRWVRARILLDGGAYASSSRAVCLNAASTAVGPYRCPAARVEAILAYTNNPPCGAMRGFGAVQTCFAYEAQMDKLAAALDLSPMEMRLRNAADEQDELPTGQPFGAPAPAARLLTLLSQKPPPDLPIGSTFSGEAAAASEPADLRRGVGLGRRLQERRLLRRIQRVLDGARPSRRRRRRRRPRRDDPHRRVRGGSGPRHRPRADRSHGAARVCRAPSHRRHGGWQRRFLVGFASDLADGRRRSRRLPRSAARARPPRGRAGRVRRRRGQPRAGRRPHPDRRRSRSPS